MYIQDPAFGENYRIHWDYNGGQVQVKNGDLWKNEGPKRTQDIKVLLHDIVKRQVADLEGTFTLDEFQSKCDELFKNLGAKKAPVQSAELPQPELRKVS